MKKSIPLITIMLLTNSTSYSMTRHALRSFKQPCMQKALKHSPSSLRLFRHVMAEKIKDQTGIIQRICSTLDMAPYTPESFKPGPEIINPLLRPEIIDSFQAINKIEAILYTTQKVLEISPLVMPESNDTDTLKKYGALKQIESKLDDSRK